jgi:hypothetical protein
MGWWNRRGVWLMKYIWHKTGTKSSPTNNEFKDMTNTLSVAECLFRGETNPALQRWNVWSVKATWYNVWCRTILGQNVQGRNVRGGIVLIRVIWLSVPPKESRGLSFTTIAAYGSNGAIIHYTPTQDTNAVIGRQVPPARVDSILYTVRRVRKRLPEKYGNATIPFIITKIFRRF